MQLGKIIKCGKKYFINEAYRFGVNSYLGFYNNTTDKKYIKNEFYYKMGKVLDLDNPQTFNEKLQWLKLYDRKLEYIKMVDKYQVKKYVAEKIGEEYIIPTLGIWDRAEDIEWDILPDKFVLKATHDSGGLVICTDKNILDKEVAIDKLNKSLRTDYYLLHREWPYKDVPRKIIAEKFMMDDQVKDLRDYKFFCFNGKVKIFKIDFDRQTNHRANYYNNVGDLLPFGEADYPPDYNKKLRMPKHLEKMIELAEKLAQDISFIRVDFYEVNSKIYFGELTFFPAAGMGKFTSTEWDYTLGRWIELPEKEEGIK